MSVQNLDPMAAAVSDAEAVSQYFGRMQVDAQFVVLRKGEPKRQWTEGDSTDGRTTEITLRLQPLDCTGVTRLVERQVLSNSSEWSKIVWASLKDLGAKSPRDIEGQWAQIKLVPSGRTWTNKNTGELVTGTTFKFVKLFTLESDCEKAWEALHDGVEAHSAPIQAQAVQPTINDAEKAAAAQFLRLIVDANRNDHVALANALASMAPLNKYFSINSPEVQSLLLGA